MLKALLTSTSNTASLSSFSNAECTACTAASIPEVYPPHNWRHPAASFTSGLVMKSTALAMICLAVSPTPIGRTPQFLSSAINRQSRRGEMFWGSTKDVKILLVLCLCLPLLQPLVGFLKSGISDTSSHFFCCRENHNDDYGSLYGIRSNDVITVCTFSSPPALCRLFRV